MDIKYFRDLMSFKDKIVKSLQELKFTQNDPNIVHECNIPYASYSPWANDKDFQPVYQKIKSHTLVDIYRCYELWQLTRELKDVRGDIMEIGVWKGGTAGLLASAGKKFSPKAKVLLFDTFKGVIKAGKHDTRYKGGEHADTTLQIVKSLLSSLKVSNFSIYKGIFPDDFGKQFQKSEIKICHIDVDTYDSAKDIVDYVWPRMVEKGIVVFDDYGCWGCEGVTKYFNQLRLPDAYKIHNLNGHGLLIKLHS